MEVDTSLAWIPTKFVAERFSGDKEPGVVISKVPGTRSLFNPLPIAGGRWSFDSSWVAEAGCEPATSTALQSGEGFPADRLKLDVKCLWQRRSLVRKGDGRLPDKDSAPKNLDPLSPLR